MFERILDHPLIEVRLETDYEDVEDEVEYDHLVYTGPIDALLRLPLRSAALPLAGVRAAQRADARRRASCLPATSVNEPSEDVPYTRTPSSGR